MGAHTQAFQRLLLPRSFIRANISKIMEFKNSNQQAERQKSMRKSDLGPEPRVAIDDVKIIKILYKWQTGFNLRLSA